jgi:oligoendopeptidase F
MLDQYRSDFAEFHVACALEHYLYHSGQKDCLEIAPIYERYNPLFDQDSINRLKRELEDTPKHFETDHVSIKRLLAFAIEQFVEDSVKRLTEEISQYEAAATVEWDGREITLQDSTVAITTEPDRRSRLAIYSRRLAVIEASNGLRAERLLKLHATARSLGYSTYVELFEQLRQLNYSVVGRQVATFLSRTDPAYITRLNEVLRRDLGLSIDEAERSDAMYLLHLTPFDGRFPSGQMLRAYSETMAGLGIKTHEQTNILIDSEPRARKNPRAFCMPISIPDDVRLVIRPSGGQSDYQSLLHESGHAQHYGWASAQLSPEFKYTGDYALTETYAFLFNHLISDGDWLGAFLGLRDNAEFIRSVMLARLVTVRRYISKLMYERQLHLDIDLARSAQLYAELQTDATKFKTDPAEFLFDLDDSFYSASYLRAWAFEVLLREHLKTHFGPRWWESRRAGDFLKQIWETGDRYTADEMAAQIGIGPIEFGPLIDEFNTALK